MVPIEIERRNAKILAALKEQAARHRADPAEARRFLMKLGCWHEDGTLKEEWGGEPRPDDPGQ